MIRWALWESIGSEAAAEAEGSSFHANSMQSPMASQAAKPNDRARIGIVRMVLLDVLCRTAALAWFRQEMASAL